MQICHNALQSENWRVPDFGLQTINGGQTARIVQQVAEEIGAAEVLVRIYKLERDDKNLVEEKALATNSQNPVDLRD